MQQLNFINFYIGAIALTGCFFCCVSAGILIFYYFDPAKSDVSEMVSSLETPHGFSAKNAQQVCEPINVTIYVDSEGLRGAPSVSTRLEESEAFKTLISDLRWNSKDVD